MKFRSAIFHRTVLALGVAATLAACGGGNSELLRQSVTASVGGTFDVAGQGVSVVVPAGAL